jgi:hypothetical protein
VPKGPKGERKPADAIGHAVHVMRIATEIHNNPIDPGKGFNRKGGLAGGPARAKNVSAKRRSRDCQVGGVGAVDKK